LTQPAKDKAATVAITIFISPHPLAC